MSFELIAPGAEGTSVWAGETGGEEIRGKARRVEEGYWDKLLTFIQKTESEEVEEKEEEEEEEKEKIEEVKTFLATYPKSEDEETNDQKKKLSALMSILKQNKEFFSDSYMNDFVHEALEAKNGFVAEKLLRVGMNSFVSPWVILEEVVDFRNRACFKTLLSLVSSDSITYRSSPKGMDITYLVELLFHIHKNKYFTHDKNLKYMDVQTSRELILGWDLEYVLDTIEENDYYVHSYDQAISMELSLKREYERENDENSTWKVERVKDLSICKKSEQKTSEVNDNGEVIMEKVMDVDPISFTLPRDPAYFISSTDEKGQVTNTCYNARSIFEAAKTYGRVKLPPTNASKLFKFPPHPDLKDLDGQLEKNLNSIIEESTTDWAVSKGVRDKSTNDTFWKNVHELILSGANVDRRNTRGETLLHVATWAYGKINFVRRLIEMGANLNARDNKGNTALHVAARMGHEAVAKKLIEAGADVSVKNHKGKTALQIAESTIGGRGVQKMLLEAMSARSGSPVR